MSDVGYSLDEVRAERERRARATRTQAAAGGAPITLEAIRRERARRASANAPPQERRPDGYTEAEGGLATFNQGLFLGAGDEVSAAFGGVGQALSSLWEQGTDDAPGIDWGAIGADTVSGAAQQYERSRGALRQFREERPNAAAFTEGSGAVAPIVITAGRAGLPRAGALQAARPATERGIGAWAAQTAEGAATGYGYGGVYGFNAGEGDWADRLESANESGALGAAFGSAAPTAVNAFRGVGSLARGPLSAAQRFIENNTPLPDPNSVGMSGGNLGARGSRTGALRPQRPEIPDAAINTIERMAQRERMSADDVGRAFETARANPQGQVTADIFGDTGVRTLRPIVQGPGETSRRAAETARQMSEEAPDIIMNALRRGLGVGETRAGAMARLEGDYRALSAAEYAPVFGQNLTPRQLALYEQRIAPLLAPDNPNATVREIMQDAIRRAERQFDLDRQTGIVDGAITDNLPRYLHYIKGAIGERAQFDASPLRGVSGREVGSIRQLYRQFGDLIDPPPSGGAVEAIVPGYRETTARAGDYFTATEALEDGAKLLNGSVDDAVARFQNATPFETDHLRIGLADEIRRLTAGDANRNANVAAVLGNRNRQQIIAAAFDTPEQAAEFLSTVSGNGAPGVPGVYRLMENRQQWRGGSSTYANAMHGADEGLHAGLEAAGRAATGDVVGAARRGVDYARNVASLGMVERANNRRGEALLRRIDSAEARAFTDEVVRILREREAGRGAAAAASQASAASASVTANRERRRD